MFLFVMYVKLFCCVVDGGLFVVVIISKEKYFLCKLFVLFIYYELVISEGIWYLYDVNVLY